MAIVEQRNRIDNAADEIFKLANLSPEQFSYGGVREILHAYFSTENWQRSDKEKLFKFFADEHNLILTDGELNDIIHVVQQNV